MEVFKKKVNILRKNMKIVLVFAYEKVKTGKYGGDGGRGGGEASGRAPQGRPTLDGWRAGRRVEGKAKG